MKHCFFVCYGGGHVAMLYPIIQAIRKDYEATILALTTAQAFLKQKNIPFIGYKDFPEAQESQVKQWGMKLSETVQHNPLVSEEETVAYLGINFYELIKVYGVENAKRLYQQKGRQSFLPVKTMESVLTRFHPDLLISTNSPRTEQAAFLAARKLEIPSICIIDLFGLQEIQWIKEPGYANKICVLNEFVKNNFLQSGKKNEEVIITGNPIFDNLYQPQVVQSGVRLRKMRNWDDEKINILWASQPEVETHPFCEKAGGDIRLPYKIESCLRAFVAENDQYRLIIRYHPSENCNFKPGYNVEFSPYSEPLEPLLHAIDLVVVTASTVGLQAHLVGKPVISVDSTIWADDVKYAQQGISIGIHLLSELPMTILNLKKTQFKKSVNYAQQKSAVQNIVKIIKDILGND